MKTTKGKPCNYGHDGTRYTSSGGCVECAKERQRRNYEKRMPEKTKKVSMREVTNELLSKTSIYDTIRINAAIRNSQRKPLKEIEIDELLLLLEDKRNEDQN